ncbi:MAG: hypothetical protein ABIT08_06615 [Bacteroidia bacterium]
MNNIDSIDKIKEALVFSCINGSPQSFIPFLLSKNVKTDYPNKTLFYISLKSTIECAKESTVGQLSLKIEQPSWQKDTEVKYFKFYDNYHKYSRLSIKVKEYNKEIFFDIMPF